MNIETIATKAEAFATRENAPKSLSAIANLIREAKGPVGLEWIADNCEAQSKFQERDDHAAQFRVIAKGLRRVVVARKAVA